MQISKQKCVEIYPREGTETSASLGGSCTRLVEIYPREGTETYSINVTRRKLVEIYPREGTETGVPVQSVLSNS